MERGILSSLIERERKEREKEGETLLIERERETLSIERGRE